MKIKALALPRVFYICHCMNDNILLTDEFDVLVPYITEMKGNPSSGAYFIELSIPPTLHLDDEKIKQYFKEDAVLTFQKKTFMVNQHISGTLRNSDVARYLYNKFSKNIHSPANPMNTTVSRLLASLY